MLSKFSVTNYMGFSDKITWDLSNPRDYSFNSFLIKNGIIKNGIIYGENGSGKTSLGRAVCDIVNLVNTTNATDYTKTIYQGAVDKPIDFEYTFNFNGEVVVYSYSKSRSGKLLGEALWHSGSLIFKRDDNEVVIHEFPVDQARIENLKQSANSVSILKFIFGTFPLAQDHYMQKMMDFISSMLWFRCVDERNFMGIDTGRVYIEDYIIKHNYLDDFQSFLMEESNQEFDFSPTLPDDKFIYCRINGNRVQFNSIFSTGTIALELLFYWIIRMRESDVKFVFIDEFDAFYHFELSMNVCRTLFKQNFQVFLSSHNTMLLTNDLLRPDCGFLIGRNQISPLSELTARGELRQAHNIEKMYRAGSFKIK